jgi:two-component system chemotaxis response regulator CheB
MKKTRVLIVDDSHTIRQLLRARLRSNPQIEVVGEARDPFEARDKIKLLNPDVLTLDVEMPRMNGLEFLEKLMRLRPMPVVMISTLTAKGSKEAIEALSLGAIDCIAKPSVDCLPETFTLLGDLLIAAAGARIRTSGMRKIVDPSTGFNWNGKFVLIGSSTGGVDALETVLAEYPIDCPPTVIVQHMPESFLVSFAARLNNRIAPQLELASQGSPLIQGRVYLAPGGEYHVGIASEGHIPTCNLFKADKRSGHRPSVDYLFESAVPIASRGVGVMLTGMGRDGAEQMLRFRQAGGKCIAQDEMSSVVFGMPRAALETGAAERAVPLQKISSAILSMAGNHGPSTPNDVFVA